MQDSGLIKNKQYHIAIFIGVLFLIVFPKGGVKIAGIPLTWGYILLGCFFILGCVDFLLRKETTINLRRAKAIAVTIPFQILIISSLLLNGYEDKGFALSLVISFCFLPWLFIMVIGHYIDKIDLTFMFKCVKNAVFYVALYGVFLFFYKMGTGHFIEIPYLTVNSGDLGTLEDKHIDRGGLFKLISTYNNGNIYGVSLLLLFPLYNQLEKSMLKKSVVNLSLILTLSRTVWIGLVLYHLLSSFYVKKVKITTVLYTTALLLVVLLGIYWSLTLMNRDASFLFDSNLGGRAEQLDYLQDVSFLPAESFFGIGEIVYLSILKVFGVLGLVFFLLSMSYPLFMRLPHLKTPYKRSLKAGLFIYLVVSFSDGAMLLIPVMAFYLFVVTLLLSSNSTFQLFNEKVTKRKRIFPKIRFKF